MKKNLYFYTLIALVCCFFAKPDISVGAGIGTISSAGVYQTNRTCSPNYHAFRMHGNSGSLLAWSDSDAVETSPNFNSGECDGLYDFEWRLQNNFPELAGAGSVEFYWDSDPDWTQILWRDALGNWSETEPPPPKLITITSPASGTTITDTATALVGNWSGIDPAIYKNITIYFSSNFIGEVSVAKIVSITNATGTFSFALSDFGQTANGQWNLKGSATFKNTQLSDMYITTDMISPVGYNLIFNVSGFHTPYSFTDFDTWYDTNVANYDTPSAWASGMIGYLQPVLEKIAEFGARIQDYLDVSTAYQRGNDIGSVFPVVNAYIEKINIFFGGFPIAQFFQWGILIMIGMFAVKIILKLLSFIPVIGGGG